jgi:hypothetical protein
MLRAILSVILAMFVTYALVFLLASVQWFALGADGTFEPGTYQVTMKWCVVAIIGAVLAALGGGIVCRSISRSPKPPMVMAAIILILGAMSAIPALMADDAPPKPRPDNASMFDAMQEVREPIWLSFVYPIIGATGVLTGSWLTLRKS